jgi:Glyoxalase superfamily protein
MSQIKKLKKEAVELESRQQTLGSPIKHCEALEQVAKKHGYSSWRACRTMLGNESRKTDDPEGALPMKRYQSAEWSFAIDFPAHWNIFPPVLSNSAHEVIRFASKEEGNFHIAIIFRAPRDPKQTTDESLSSIQQHLESLGFGNFKPGEAPAGSRMLATLDFSKPKDGRTWSCRYYFVEAGTLEYRIGFGSDAPEKIVDIRQHMAQSFEVLPATL